MFSSIYSDFASELFPSCQLSTQDSLITCLWPFALRKSWTNKCIINELWLYACGLIQVKFWMNFDWNFKQFFKAFDQCSWCVHDASSWLGIIPSASLGCLGRILNDRIGRFGGGDIHDATRRRFLRLVLRYRCWPTLWRGGWGSRSGGRSSPNAVSWDWSQEDCRGRRGWEWERVESVLSVQSCRTVNCRSLFYVVLVVLSSWVRSCICLVFVGLKRYLSLLLSSTSWLLHLQYIETV